MSSLFGSDERPTPTAPQAPTPPPVMPDPFAPDVMAARRRSVTESTRRGGRSSTTLTAPGRASSTLAGGYSGGTLGTA